jgi:peptidoglycan-associated lipoprotein
MKLSNRRARGRSTGLVLLAVAGLLAACGGHKRPPVLSGTPSTAAPSVPPRAPEPVDTRPDVDRLSNDSALGSDTLAPADANTEGGPLEDIRFEYDSSALGDAARQTLSQHASWLKAHANAAVTVEGHCDERGTVDYNLALGEQRARAAKEYLVGLGVAAGRLRTVSFGKEKPLDPASNEAAWAKNRRAHFVVVGG